MYCGVHAREEVSSPVSGAGHGSLWAVDLQAPFQPWVGETLPALAQLQTPPGEPPHAPLCWCHKSRWLCPLAWHTLIPTLVFILSKELRKATSIGDVKDICICFTEPHPQLLSL